MKKSVVMAFIVGLVIGAAVFASLACVQGYAAQRQDWSKLKICDGPDVLIFDPDTGKLYHYNGFGKCDPIYQLVTLGEPMTELPLATPHR